MFNILKILVLDLLAGSEVTRIIAESDERLDHIAEVIRLRTELIQNLRKRLHQSSNILHRRENKLEEKINQGKDLKSELQKVVAESDNLKVALEQKSKSLAKEQELVQIKDKEIKDLLTKMSELERNLNTMYRRMSDRDKELNDARNQLFTYTPCPECGWMRDYIHRLEYQLQHYRYPDSPRTYRYSNDILTLSPDYRQNNQWSEPHCSPNSPLRNSPQQRPPGQYKSKRSESYWRQQAVNRQRLQEFRNASLALSPIKEDTEEVPKAAENKKGAKTNSETISDQALVSVSVAGERAKQVNENKVNNVFTESSTYSNSLSTSSSMTSPADSCRYLTVRSEQESPNPVKTEKNSMAYLHIQSGNFNQQTTGANRYSSSSPPIKLVNESRSSKSAVNERTEADLSRGDATFNNPLTSTPKRPSETSLLHRLAVSNARSSPDLVSRSKAFVPVRSFPFLNGSVTSSGSVASTESPASDTTGCSSDSGLAHKSEPKRIKTRRSKRSKQNSKYITFRDHKIDVTRFSTPDFRQIMWSLCVEPSSADEFLNFLATHAKRLQSDPQWAEKHSLGTPEEWLALKGSY